MLLTMLIEKTDAEKQQIQVNTVLGLQGVLDDETIVQNICDILELDYESIKDKLPADDEKVIQDAQDTLEGVIVNE